MGRPERVLSEEEIKELEQIAPSLTQEQIAAYFGISDNTLREILKRDKSVSEVYNRSKTRAGIAMVEKLYDKAMEGDHPSMKLWLSQRMGWTEKSRTEHVGDGGGPVEIDQHWIVELVAPGED
jgi:Zn-dependent peptidase ImmA (M78 family)